MSTAPKCGVEETLKVLASKIRFSK